ncbi:thiamine transporter membrane protein [Psychromonas sp. CNPT3]|uniref:thiamine/thiamine pyrophosphate ABC transporter permease n=1 Tax=Psychromonas sp. CNPT3 TaxID=314282 RepID=UPI00006E98E5|nr:thiamine/thiamine pyrophosphate ABC transporter permease [Psychromonas sp. CNPT3]AGH81153.1 thiamine transporter membrane protein [Psychromonas sp. CNPT3]
MLLKKVQIPGLLLAGFISFFVAGALIALLAHSTTLNVSALWQDPYYRHITTFSFYQAFLSTLLSVVLAIPISHALYRREFWGKALLLKLFASTLVLPVLVAIFGLLSIYGNSGLLAQLLTKFQASLPFSIYGLKGILLAHVFFNLPFATRLFLQALQSIPEPQHKLAAHLGMTHWLKFKYLEWPHIRGQLTHVAGLIFMLCFTSFATVMAIGGGPKATTIELAIYQAIKFDFDLQSGALLALWQMSLCALLAFFIQKTMRSSRLSASYTSVKVYLFSDRKRDKCWDFFCITLVIAFVIPPLLMVLVAGLNEKLLIVLSDFYFWMAFKNSMIIAISAGFLALTLAFFILLCSRVWRMRGLHSYADNIEILATIILVTPGLVISTGLFLLLREFNHYAMLPLFIVIVVNALMALPFALKNLAEPMLHNAQKYDKLCASLGIFSGYRFYLIEWKALKIPIVQAFSLSFALSIGDLSAIALFGNRDFSTLPLYLFQLMGSYQMQSAAVVALILLLLSVGIFILTERIFHLKRVQND